MITRNNNKNYLVIVCFLVCWTTIVSQFILIIQNRVVSIAETLARFFTFFTILTNIIVAITFTVIWLQPKSRINFFLKPNTQTAIAVYIFVVGFIYNTILRFIWQPQGIQKIIDEMLHLIIPTVYILYWYFEVKKTAIIWRNILGWLIYPILYLIVIMIRGTYSNYYPYPFVNVSELGLVKVAINSVYLTIFFGTMSVVFVGIAKYISSNKK
ncbi:Pr6Pr family membrane protein [Flavobacterium sp.]|uniref:Pr6Pr family membrane protein n=1 Tax=Flavobacterium sp. TaxID=239 RepID=UPI0037501211